MLIIGLTIGFWIGLVIGFGFAAALRTEDSPLRKTPVDPETKGEDPIEIKTVKTGNMNCKIGIN